MRINESFHAEYEEWQKRVEAAAQSRGEIRLPDLEPEGPVDWVLVCMEPSLGRWTRGGNEQRREFASSRIKEGFRNHLPSGNVAILHFCIRQYLCPDRQRYHITDLAKGAKLVEDAAADRERTYRYWYPLFQEEIRIVGPEAGIIPVGCRVEDFLARHELPRLWPRIVHYSPLAQQAWRDGIEGHANEFEAFKDSISVQDLVTTALEVLKSGKVSAKICNEETSRLNKLKLNTSRQRLIFNYKLAFESIREGALR